MANSLTQYLAQFLRDLRFGARNLARSRSFAAIAAGSLALGIGGSTAMYSVIHAVILDPFPYKDPHRLMSVNIRGERGGNGSYYRIDDFLDIAERNSVFEGVIASTWSDVTWTGDGEPQRLRGNHCTMNTFDIMGVPPLIGRTVTGSDSAPGAEPVTVLGYKFWQSRFGGDPGVLGRKLRLNDRIRTVIGVMPQRFMWRGADVYLPDVFHRGATVEGETDVHLLGRLKPGVTREQAAADLRPIIEEIGRRNPNAIPKQWTLRLLDFGETFPSDIRKALWVLFGAVGLLLLIACVNVSNLLLSRAAGRRREIAIRASMGATRFRLVRQLLTESLILAAVGAAGGVLIAVAGLRGIIAMVPPNTIPDEAKIELNAPVLWFTLAVAVGTALLFGLAPALHLSGRDILTPLREAGRGLSGGVRQRIVRSILVAGEVGLSLMLLIGASLMIRTLLAVQGGGPSIQPDSILTVRIPFSERRYKEVDRRDAFLEELIRRVQSVPGVVAAGINGGMPPVYNWQFAVEIPGAPPADNSRVMLHQVNPDYARVMGVTLAEGRFLTDPEVHARIHSAIVNQELVRRHFPNGSAIGRVIRIPRLRTAPFNSTDDAFQIVGVVKDTVNQAATREIIPEAFIPHTVLGWADRLYVLAAGRAGTIDRAVKQQVYSLDPDQPVMEDQPLEAVLAENAYAQPRFNLLLLAIFAGVGLTLALLGVYGVVSHSVAQQTREIGIRLALGASFGQVTGMVLRTGVRLLAFGIAAGLLASFASVRVLSGLVRSVSTFDPYSFIGVTLLLFLTGLFASFWPARRAARVDPVTALRSE